MKTIYHKVHKGAHDVHKGRTRVLVNFVETFVNLVVKQITNDA